MTHHPENSTLSRRVALAGAVGVAAAASNAVVPALATGPTPALGAVEHGFRRFRLGDMEVNVLLDGGMQMPEANAPRFFVDFDAAVVARLRERAFHMDGFLHQPVGSYLVNTGRNLVMIDTGGHASFMPMTGRMMRSFMATGYRPEQVDTVLLTHIHPEHALGLVGEGETRAFPNAEVIVTEQDFALWSADDAASRVPQGAPFANAAKRSMAPYRDRTRRYDMTSTREILPGITVMPAPGHTPGHVSYVLASGNQSMLIWGDVAHQIVIQLANPRWRLSIDVDRDMAVQSRLRTLDMLATDRIMVGGVHLPWPGVGRIIRDGEGFAFIQRPWQLG